MALSGRAITLRGRWLTLSADAETDFSILTLHSGFGKIRELALNVSLDPQLAD